MSPARTRKMDGVDPEGRGPAELTRLTRRGFWLEYASMAWMTVEASVAVASGIIAGSIALIGFGLDSVIEFFAAAVVVWQLRGGGEERESRAVRLIGITFFILAAYLVAASIRDLISQARPGQPVAGLIVTAAALVVMPSLAVAKHRTGEALDNQALTADAAESAICAFTSGAALLGVGLNAWLGWWWADPAAALVIAALAVREGLEVWEDDLVHSGEAGQATLGAGSVGQIGHDRQSSGRGVSPSSSPPIVQLAAAASMAPFGRRMRPDFVRPLTRRPLTRRPAAVGTTGQTGRLSLEARGKQQQGRGSQQHRTDLEPDHRGAGASEGGQRSQADQQRRGGPVDPRADIWSRTGCRCCGDDYRGGAPHGKCLGQPLLRDDPPVIGADGLEAGQDLTGRDGVRHAHAATSAAPR